MPNGKKKPDTSKTFLDIMEKDIQSGVKLSELGTDSANLLNLLFLIVDIEYRRKYGAHPQVVRSRGYKQVNTKDNTPAEWLPPIESETAGLNSMGDRH